MEENKEETQESNKALIGLIGIIVALLVLIIFNIVKYEKIDYRLELNKDGTITINDSSNISLDSLEEFIEKDNL